MDVWIGDGWCDVGGMGVVKVDGRRCEGDGWFGGEGGQGMVGYWWDREWWGSGWNCRGVGGVGHVGWKGVVGRGNQLRGWTDGLFETCDGVRVT